MDTSDGREQAAGTLAGMSQIDQIAMNDRQLNEIKCACDVPTVQPAVPVPILRRLGRRAEAERAPHIGEMEPLSALQRGARPENSFLSFFTNICIPHTKYIIFSENARRRQSTKARCSSASCSSWSSRTPPCAGAHRARPPPPPPHLLFLTAALTAAPACRPPRSRGDGNCFFRSVLFSLMEGCLLRGDSARLRRLRERLLGWKDKFRSLGYQDLAYEDSLDLVLSTLDGLLATPPMPLAALARTPPNPAEPCRTLPNPAEPEPPPAWRARGLSSAALLAARLRRTHKPCLARPAAAPG